MLRDVRAGRDVLGIFYGHPGVFVSPYHRAIALAREEGYKARMLPGVSAEDYMFADLEFDPSQYGCMTCEATEVLLRDRPLNPSVHNIIWQVGGVGIATTEFNVSTYYSTFLPLLTRTFLAFSRTASSICLLIVSRRISVLITRLCTTSVPSFPYLPRPWTHTPLLTSERRTS